MWAELNQNRSHWVLAHHLTWECAITTPLHSRYELDRQPQPSQRGCHCWKLQDQLFTFCGRLLLLPSSQQGLQHERDWFSAACDRTGMKASTKRPRKYISPETQVSVFCKEFTIHCSISRSSNTFGWYSQVTEGGTRRLVNGLAKQTQFCLSFIAFW